MTSTVAASGQVIGARYRLQRELGTPGADGHALLWLANDLLAAEAPVVLRRADPDHDPAQVRELWARLQGVLHPQVPRFGAVMAEAHQLWLAREWQGGRTYDQLLEARRERQLVFGAGEVLLLLRQLLPVLAALHGQGLLHGDISPANLLRRDSDGLPVLLDFGLVRGLARGAAPAAADATGPIGATPGYAPPELGQGDPALPWMDLHALGVVALVLLSGDEPAALLDPVSLAWRWPAALEEEPALQQQLERLLSRDPNQRFPSAGQALAAFQALEMPDSTGPVPRADRTVMLVPPPAPGPVAAAPPPADAATAEAAPPPPQTASPPVPPPAPPEAPPAPALPPTEAEAETEPEPTPPTLPRRRHEAREEEAEGGLWPVLIALVLSAIVGTALGWWWLGRGKVPSPSRETTAELPSSLPPAEVDQRQSLLNRLRAMQVDRSWFLSLVDASLLAQYPERKGRLPSDSLEDAPLRRVWNELAEEWLARVEQLPLALRQRLGSFSSADWDRRQAGLVSQGLSPAVLNQLVSGSARNLLPGRKDEDIPPEPFRQLWYAAADQTLAGVRIEPIEVPSSTTQLISAEVDASSARLFPIRLPAGHALVLGANGTPLLQMSVFAADGRPLEAKGPLRVVNLGFQKSSPVQLLITNEGVAPAEIRLSLRADPPPPPAAPPPPDATDSTGAPPGTEPPAPEVPAPPAPPGTPATPEPAAPAAPPAAAPAAPAGEPSPPKP